MRGHPEKLLVEACLPSVHLQVYLLGPSVHLAPFLHGVLAHSSMSIWQRFPVKPENKTRGCYCVLKKCVYVCANMANLFKTRSANNPGFILKSSQFITKSAY